MCGEKDLIKSGKGLQDLNQEGVIMGSCDACGISFDGMTLRFYNLHMKKIHGVKPITTASQLIGRVGYKDSKKLKELGIEI